MQVVSMEVKTQMEVNMEMKAKVKAAAGEKGVCRAEVRTRASLAKTLMPHSHDRNQCQAANNIDCRANIAPGIQLIEA